MKDDLSEKMEALSRLQIDRGQRPKAGGKGWMLLAGMVLVVGLVAAGAAWWYYRTTGGNIVAALSEKTTDVNVVIVPAAQSAADSVALVANGRIVSDRLVNVSTKVSGQIVELNVEQGDQVEKDQVLARIEDVIYRAQRDEAAARVAQTEHDIARAQAEQARAEAAIRQARAEHDFRKRDHDRLLGLRDRGQASDTEYLDAKNLYESADAAVAVAQASATSAAAIVQMKSSELAAAESILRVWQKRLDDCNIRAPIAGVVLERNAQVGDFLAAEGGRGANANAQLVSIADMTLLRVEIDVSERDVDRLFAGQRARITPDAGRTPYPGELMWIDPVGDYARATVQVKVRVLEPGPNLRVDGSAKVEFLAAAPVETAEPATAALWLPKSAVRLYPGSEDAVVFTVASGRAMPHAIRVGTRTDKSVEIRTGVVPGMQLICENLANLDEGSPVRVVRTLTLDQL